MKKRPHAGRRQILIRFWILLCQAASQPIKLRVCLIKNHARLEPTQDCGRVTIGAKQQLPTRLQWKLIVIWHPDFLGDGEFEIGRHDPDDGGRFAINSNALANNFGIAVEISLPNLIAQKSNLFRTGLVVIGGEITTHDRRHADDLEEIFRDITAGVALPIVFVGHVNCRATQVASHQGERLLIRLQIFVILRRWNNAEAEIVALIARFRINQPHAHQLLWMRK